MTSKEKRKWAKKLKPYWDSFRIINGEFHRNIGCLEDRMKIELGEELEFIYGEMDMGFIGIGHATERKRFPLFQAESLGGY